MMKVVGIELMQDETVVKVTLRGKSATMFDNTSYVYMPSDAPKEAVPDIGDGFDLIKRM